MYVLADISKAGQTVLTTNPMSDLAAGAGARMGYKHPLGKASLGSEFFCCSLNWVTL